MSNVSVPVINDNIVEGSEEFNLMLNVQPSLGPAITADSSGNTAVGIITDSTSKCVIVKIRIIKYGFSSYLTTVFTETLTVTHLKY